MGNSEVQLIAHLMRRAGFGATRDQLDAHAAKGYEETVEELLLDPREERRMADGLIRRFHPELSAMMGPFGAWGQLAIPDGNDIRSTTGKADPFLAWHLRHRVPQSQSMAKSLSDQTRMFRRYGMGSFRKLLVELSKDPAMIIWLDNQDNHKGAINENYGRELLELFSMGVGNYSEKMTSRSAPAPSRAGPSATGEYMELRSHEGLGLALRPHSSWHFEYLPDDHDDGEKEFLGQRGRFNGEDVIDIICQQEATARFISRHLYSFFVADEPGVPQWPYTPPADPQAIEQLSRAYFDSNYDITSMLRVLFNADFFRSQRAWYTKVKGPVELVAGVLRLTGEFDRPRREMTDRHLQAQYMGQWLNNPPSVEGWHQGTEWLDTGNLVERVNFATQQIGNESKPGVQAMIGRIASGHERVISPEGLVDACLDQVGSISVSDDTRRELVDFAARGGDVHVGSGSPDEAARQRIVDVLQMVASTHDFQRA